MKIEIKINETFTKKFQSLWNYNLIFNVKLKKKKIQTAQVQDYLPEILHF